MFISRLLSGATLLIGLQAQALPTAALSPEHRNTLGKQLASHAGASQWQQLWQRSRQAGHFEQHANLPYFSLSPAQIVQVVAQTLSHPGETKAVNQTQVLYRRDFQDQTVGQQAGARLSAVCIWVDWRTLPAHALNQPSPYLGQISMLLTHPCQ